MSQPAQLKPCPFCAAAATPPYKYESMSGTYWAIQCERFCVSMQRPTKSKLVKDWNTRKG